MSEQQLVLMRMPLGPLGTNCYVIGDKVVGEAFIIDPATPEVLDALKKHDLKPKAILLTHGHGDHIGGVQDIVNAHHVPVYVHKGDVPYLSDPELNLSAYSNPTPIKVKADIIEVQQGDHITCGDIDLEVLETLIMNTTLEKLKERIKDKKYKLTTQRQTILQAFIDADENHLSAEDVYVLVKEVAPDIGLATIYRTLDLFTELDLLKRLDFGDGRNRYELNDEEFAHFHHHLICVKCGKVSEFEDDMLETLESIIAKKLNFRTIDHQLKVYGYCSDCQNHMTEAELDKLERMAHHHG